MSFTKANILNSYIDYPFYPDIFSKDALENESLLLSKNSQSLVLKPKKEDNNFSNAFLSQSEFQEKKGWRNSPKDYPQKPSPSGQSKHFEFSRGANFRPKEEIVPLKIDNIFNFNQKFNYPKELPSFYIRSTLNKFFFGPISSNDIRDLYNANKLDSTYEIRPIDLFGFQSQESFEFKSIKEINNDKWEYIIEDSPLLKYTFLNKNFEELKEKFEELKLKEEAAKEEIKEEDNVKEEVKEDIKQPIFPVKISSHKDDDIWEDPNKKKKKVRPGQVKPTVVGMATNKNEKINKVNTTFKKEEKNEGLVSPEELVNMLKPKPIIQVKEEETSNANNANEIEEDDGFKASGPSTGGKKKGKKKKRPTDATNINLGFQY